MLTLNLIPFIIIFSCFCIGFYFIGKGYKALRNDKASEKWPTVTGRIVTCSEKEYQYSSLIKAEYTYIVNDQIYRCNTIAYGYNGSSCRKYARKIMEVLNKAEGVQVRYNPTNPKEATLSHGDTVSIKRTIWGGISWVSFLFGALLPSLLGDNNAAILSKMIIS